MMRLLDHWIARLLLSVCAIFAPIASVLAVICFLVFSDLIFGIWSAKKRGEKITSSGLRRTVIKFVIYETAVAFGYLCETLEKWVAEGHITQDDARSYGDGTPADLALLEFLHGQR